MPLGVESLRPTESVCGAGEISSGPVGEGARTRWRSLAWQSRRGCRRAGDCRDRLECSRSRRQRLDRTYAVLRGGQHALHASPRRAAVSGQSTPRRFTRCAPRSRFLLSVGEARVVGRRSFDAGLWHRGRHRTSATAPRAAPEARTAAVGTSAATHALLSSNPRVPCVLALVAPHAGARTLTPCCLTERALNWCAGGSGWKIQSRFPATLEP